MKVFQKLNKYFLALLGVLMASAVFFGETNATFAAEIPDYRLQISPAREDIGELEPGETYTKTLHVQNTGAKSFDFKLSVSPYSVADENYAPQTQENQYTDIVSWIKFSKTTGTVDPNGDVEIAYTVTVPADVPTGGQYAMLTAEITNIDENLATSGITTINRVGMLLYSNVKGNTRKTASIPENKIPSILFNPPVSATSIVENSGNTHATARYVLQVYPLFGDEEVYTNEENPAELTILPETRRLNTITWPNAPHLGIFRVKQTVTIFNETSTTEKLVFLCPIWFLFIIIALIFCIIFWIVTRVRARKQNNIEG